MSGQLLDALAEGHSPLLEVLAAAVERPAHRVEELRRNGAPACAAFGRAGWSAGWSLRPYRHVGSVSMTIPVWWARSGRPGAVRSVTTGDRRREKGAPHVPEYVHGVRGGSGHHGVGQLLEQRRRRGQQAPRRRGKAWELDRAAARRILRGDRSEVRRRPVAHLQKGHLAVAHPKVHLLPLPQKGHHLLARARELQAVHQVKALLVHHPARVLQVLVLAKEPLARDTHTTHEGTMQHCLQTTQTWKQLTANRIIQM